MKAFRVLSVIVLGGVVTIACGRGSARVPSPSSTPVSGQYLGDATAANSTPVLASSGRWVVAAWTAAQRDETNVYAAVSEDGGTQFQPPVRVNDVTGEAHVYGEDPPRVAMGPAPSPNAPPEIVVTWPSDRAKHLGLRSAHSVDGGRTFLPSISIGDVAIAGERGFQSVALGQDHVVRAAWLDQRRDPGTPHHANAGEDWDPMHLMYASASGGNLWNAETRLATNVCGCCKTAILTGADGAVYVAFRNIYPGNLRDIAFAASRDGGRTFAPPVRISEDHWSLNGCPDDGPTMQIDSTGTIHIIWPTLVQRPEPAIGLFHVSTRDGVTFTAREAIPTAGTPKPAHPQLIADGSGTLTLVWDEAEGATHRAWLRRLTPLSSGDVQAGELHVLSGDLPAVYPVVAATAGGVVAAWTEVGKTDDRSAIAVRRVDFAAYSGPSRPAAASSADQQSSKKAHVFKGTIEKVDEKAKRLTVANENIPGWMMAMTMSYGVDNETVLKQIKVGDQITATVYDGDFKTLHDVKVAPPEKKK
jgi:Cu/Ag efflux protein CusF